MIRLVDDFDNSIDTLDKLDEDKKIDLSNSLLFESNLNEKIGLGKAFALAGLCAATIYHATLLLNDFKNVSKKLGVSLSNIPIIGNILKCLTSGNSSGLSDLQSKAYSMFDDAGVGTGFTAGRENAKKGGDPLAGFDELFRKVTRS